MAMHVSSDIPWASAHAGAYAERKRIIHQDESNSASMVHRGYGPGPSYNGGFSVRTGGTTMSPTLPCAVRHIARAWNATPDERARSTLRQSPTGSTCMSLIAHVWNYHKNWTPGEVMFSTSVSQLDPMHNEDEIGMRGCDSSGNMLIGIGSDTTSTTFVSALQANHILHLRGQSNVTYEHEYQPVLTYSSPQSTTSSTTPKEKKSTGGEDIDASSIDTTKQSVWVESVLGYIWSFYDKLREIIDELNNDNSDTTKTSDMPLKKEDFDINTFFVKNFPMLKNIAEQLSKTNLETLKNHMDIQNSQAHDDAQRIWSRDTKGLTGTGKEKYNEKQIQELRVRRDSIIDNKDFTTWKNAVEGYWSAIEQNPPTQNSKDTSDTPSKSETKHILRKINIKPASNTYLSIVGILTDNRLIGDAYCELGTVVEGEASCLNYWGPTIDIGDHVGFIVHMTHTNNTAKSKTRMYPWHSNSIIPSWHDLQNPEKDDVATFHSLGVVTNITKPANDQSYGAVHHVLTADDKTKLHHSYLGVVDNSNKEGIVDIDMGHIRCAARGIMVTVRVDTEQQQSIFVLKNGTK